MHELPSDYLTAAKASGRYPNIRAVIQGVGTITGDDAILECHIFRGDSAKPAYFETALALSSECRITVDRRRLSAESGLVSGRKVEVTAFFQNSYGGEIGSAKLGTFYITSYDKSDKTNGIITASDRMLYTGVDFNPEGLTYPCPISDMLTEAFEQSGLSTGGIGLPIDPSISEPAYKSETPVAEGMNGNPYSCREVIARIAGMNLGAMFIDADEIPKIYGYQSAGTLRDENILDMRIGSETYYIDQVLVYKTEERMAKKKNGYRQLPYAPRFENMDEIGEGTEWLTQIIATASRIRNKPWTTATVTIQGVGQVEPGDFVSAAGTTLFVTGIAYDFASAHFTETLYSYAYTEEEYYMAPQKTVEVSTGTEKGSKGGGGSSGFNFTVAVNEPTLLKTGDFIIKTDESDATQVTGLQVLKSGGSWDDISEYQYGSNPSGIDPSANEGLYYIVVASGQPRAIIRAEKGVWSTKAYESGTSGELNKFFLNSVPSGTAKNGDHWVKINNTTDKEASEWYKAVSGKWVLQFKFGGGSAEIVIGNGLTRDSQGRVAAKLGEGLSFDSNGAIQNAYEPVVNVEHALIYKRST